jgi:hypothetical protein
VSGVAIDLASVTEISDWLADALHLVSRRVREKEGAIVELEERVRALAELLDLCDGPRVDVVALRRRAGMLVDFTTSEPPPGPALPPSMEPLERRLVSLHVAADESGHALASLRLTEQLLTALLEVVLEHGRHPGLRPERLRRRRR